MYMSRVQRNHSRMVKLKHRKFFQIFSLVCVLSVGLFIFASFSFMPVSQILTTIQQIVVPSIGDMVNTGGNSSGDIPPDSSVQVPGEQDLNQQQEVSQEGSLNPQEEQVQKPQQEDPIEDAPVVVPATVPAEWEEKPAPEEKPVRYDKNKPMVALTFDDGPSEYTWQIVQALENAGGRATFFVVGNRVPTHQAALERILSIGNEIASHSFSHPSLVKLSQDQIRVQVQNTDAVLVNAVGITAALLRPPYGAINEQVAQTVGKPMILWSVDTQDWKSRNKDKVIQHVKTHVQDGDIVLMHDLYESTAEAVEVLAPWLVEQGYQLVTVSELYEARGIPLEPGQTYHGRIKPVAAE